MLTFSWLLMILTGMLLCSLIRGGFVTDKVVLRRLVKLVVSYCEQGGCITENSTSSSSTDPPASSTAALPSSGDALPVRAPTSLVVAADRSTVIHIVHAVILAELFVIGTTADAQQGRFIAPAVKSAVSSMIMEHISVLSPLWFGTAVDGTRIMWAENTATSSNGACGAGAGANESRDLDALFGAEVSVESVSSTPGADTGRVSDHHNNTIARVFNPLRGGLTYSAEAAAGTSQACIRTELRDFLIGALPVSVAAYINSCTPSSKASLSSPKGKSRSSSNVLADVATLPVVPPTKVLPLFAVAHSALRLALSPQGSVVGSSINLNSLEHLLSSLLVLARKDAPTVATSSTVSSEEPHPYVIPASEWTDLIALLTSAFNLLQPSAAAERALFELCDTLSERVARMKNAVSESAQVVDTMWLALWRIGALMLNAVDHCLIDSFDPVAWMARIEFQVPTLTTSCSIKPTVKTGTSCIKTIAVAKVLSKLAALKPSVGQFSAHALTLLLLRELASINNSSSTTTLNVSVSVENVEEGGVRVVENISQLLSDMPDIIHPLICVQLLQNMHDWVVTQDMAGKKDDSLIAQVVDNSLSVWQRIATKISNQVIKYIPV